uniref:Ig-like domain-containing protein n=1 Tax=Varanus komodoensis TaxID=61221 RepID=A0A8D2J3K6_VARKO
MGKALPQSPAPEPFGLRTATVGLGHPAPGEDTWGLAWEDGDPGEGAGSLQTSGGNITAVLGGSATFQVETAKEFTLISWTRSLGRKGTEILAYLKPKPPCEATILIPAFSKRMNVSADCKQLHIHELRRTDSGLYTAQTQLPSSSASLRAGFLVFPSGRLPKPTITVRSTKGTCDVTLSCAVAGAAGPVSYAWSSANASMVLPRGPTLHVRQKPPDGSLEYTCTASSKESENSSTVSLREHCHGEAQAEAVRLQTRVCDTQGPRPVAGASHHRACPLAPPLPNAATTGPGKEPGLRAWSRGIAPADRSP